MKPLNYRHLLQITLETTAPLQIGSGEKSIKTDSLIVRDVNGLPFIPGTTLAGLMAHALGTEKESLMGSQEGGSRLIVTEAKLVGKDGIVLDGLVDRTQLAEDFLKHYDRLPIRQHVSINAKGTAKDAGKFDEEVVLKGSRFCFELELMSDKDASTDINALLDIIQSPTFRIGSGSRSGFGEIKVVKCLQRKIDLTQKADRVLYLDKSSKLESSKEVWQVKKITSEKQQVCEGWTTYHLSLTPEDFILFGSGFGDDSGDADITYVREAFIKWNEDKGELVNQEKAILIPATSVKGALSHRTAFHYNRLTNAVIKEDGTLANKGDINSVTGQNNAAVRAIFGFAGNENDKQRGNILISDVINEIKPTTKPKILNHVSIDRFTGGAIDGALFHEQTLYAKGETIEIDILVADKAFEGEDKNIQEAFEAALADVASGMLPLGGGVNRGNGIFTGKVTKNINNIKYIYNKENKTWEKLV